MEGSVLIQVFHCQEVLHLFGEVLIVQGAHVDENVSDLCRLAGPEGMMEHILIVVVSLLQGTPHLFELSWIPVLEENLDSLRAPFLQGHHQGCEALGVRTALYLRSRQKVLHHIRTVVLGGNEERRLLSPF